MAVQWFNPYVAVSGGKISSFNFKSPEDFYNEIRNLPSVVLSNPSLASVLNVEDYINLMESVEASKSVIVEYVTKAHEIGIPVIAGYALSSVPDTIVICAANIYDAKVVLSGYMNGCLYQSIKKGSAACTYEIDLYDMFVDFNYSTTINGESLQVTTPLMISKRQNLSSYYNSYVLLGNGFAIGSADTAFTNDIFPFSGMKIEMPSTFPTTITYAPQYPMSVCSANISGDVPYGKER